MKQVGSQIRKVLGDECPTLKSHSITLSTYEEFIPIKVILRRRVSSVLVAVVDELMPTIQPDGIRIFT